MKIPKYIKLIPGEKVIKMIDDQSNWVMKMSGSAAGAKSVGKFVFGEGVQFGDFFITNLRLIFESNNKRVVDEFSHTNVVRTEGRNATMWQTSELNIFTGSSAPSDYTMRDGKEVSDFLNEKFYNDNAKNNMIKSAAMEREKHLDYQSAIKIYDEHDMAEDAARVRKLMAEQSAVKVDQTVVHGDYVDDRDTIIKDSVVSKSSIGGGSSKMQELEKLKEMFDSGFISKKEMEKMKKEIMGK
jgi:hypothetical protein